VLLSGCCGLFTCLLDDRKYGTTELAWITSTDTIQIRSVAGDPPVTPRELLGTMTYEHLVSFDLHKLSSDYCMTYLRMTNYVGVGKRTITNSIQYI